MVRFRLLREVEPINGRGHIFEWAQRYGFGSFGSLMNETHAAYISFDDELWNVLYDVLLT